MLILLGIKESDTGLAPPSQWDLVADKQMMQEEQPLQVARCTKIINAGTEEAKYIINVKQIAKFVVGLGERVAPTDIEEGMRVGYVIIYFSYKSSVDRNKYQIQIPLPPKIDPSVTMMTVEEKPDVTYKDVGGSKDQIDKIREVVELPLLHVSHFIISKLLVSLKGLSIWVLIPQRVYYCMVLQVGVHPHRRQRNFLRYWKDSVSQSCGQSNGRMFYSSYWQ